MSWKLITVGSKLGFGRCAAILFAVGFAIGAFTGGGSGMIFGSGTPRVGGGWNFRFWK